MFLVSLVFLGEEDMGFSFYIFRVVICFFAYVLVGCSAVVPLESMTKDLEAKEFAPVENKSQIYVVRPCDYGKLHDVSIDGGTRFSLACQNYIVFLTDPGTHRISAHSSENRDVKNVITNGGKNYFVEMGWKMGSGTGDVRTSLSILNEAEGMKAVRESQLISLSGY